MANPKLRVDVNHNPTKKGIKVQFVMPQTVEGDAKAEMTQKLQAKLNQGLAQYGLTVSQDTDVPYANVIGFLIPIADVKLMIKKAITGGAAPTAPEEPVAEVRRIKELAGLINEKFAHDDFDDDIVGKRGIDYNNDQGTIIAAAQAKNYKSLIKYDPSGLLSSDGVDGSIDPLAIIVAFKSDKGDVGVYPLGDHGVRVIKGKYR